MLAHYSHLAHRIPNTLLSATLNLFLRLMQSIEVLNSGATTFTKETVFEEHRS